MITDALSKVEIDQLKALWKEAFGDSDSFIDLFFKNAYDPKRCRFFLNDATQLAVTHQIPAEIHAFGCQFRCHVRNNILSFFRI